MKKKQTLETVSVMVKLKNLTPNQRERVLTFLSYSRVSDKEHPYHKKKNGWEYEYLFLDKVMDVKGMKIEDHYIIFLTEIVKYTETKKHYYRYFKFACVTNDFINFDFSDEYCCEQFGE